MPPSVTPVAFTPDMLTSHMVQGFDCGSEAYESEITEWLKGEPGQPGAANDVAAGNPVWLYVADGELVGTASVGATHASFPKNSSLRRPATCITWLGVDRRHRGKGYGRAIMDHILAECAANPGRTLICLFVRDGNPAIQMYTDKFNFKVISGPKPGVHDCHILVLNLTP